jgi:peptide/nickel transport system substrate-binding protein
MKKLCAVLTAALLLLSVMNLGAGGQAPAEDKMIIREASQVPGLIFPPVWDGQTLSLNASIYDFLVELEHGTGELVPSLAKEWSTPDGKVWTLKLREGVKFHDGSDFTSEDVRYTLELTQDPDVGHLKKADFEVVERIDTPDDYTVVLHLSEVRPTFIYQLTDYHVCVLSSEYDYASKGETAPMGTGPFVLKQMIPKESALLVKNEEYWNEGYPKADELRIYFVPDIDASVSMLEAGKVDVCPFVNTIHKKNLEAKGFKVVSPYQEYRFVAMAADREPFDDNRVRLAMKYTMDPEVLAKACQGELGSDVYYNETPILNVLPQYHEIPFRGRDINKVKQLLAEAGYPNGLSVELYYGSDHPYGQELAKAVKELAAPAGFDIQLKGYTRDVYLSQYWMNGPMLLTGWGPRVDPSMILALAYHSEGPWNESHMADAEVDELIGKISTEVNDAKRQQYYDRLQEVFHERGTVMNVQVPYFVAMRQEVMDYRQPPTFMTQYESGVAYIFISHDLHVINYISDYIMVMYLGRICEYGKRDEVIFPPYHPYTEALLSAVPEVDPTLEKRMIRLEGSPPNPTEKIIGCPFAGRCHRKVGSICDTNAPPRLDFSESHFLFCHIPAEELTANGST